MGNLLHMPERILKYQQAVHYYSSTSHCLSIHSLGDVSRIDGLSNHIQNTSPLNSPQPATIALYLGFFAK